MMLHMTEKSSGYFENLWVWVADHEIGDKDQIQINISTARGGLIESQDTTWLWGIASEHFVLYQYQISGACNLVMGLIQTEESYFQSSPKALAPFEGGLSPSRTIQHSQTAHPAPISVPWPGRCASSTRQMSMPSVLATARPA
ncbi:hypothetical protein B0I35DRAFT_429396 [Stachybotrys elegans]|uniref:Uncharacterized protein n=1 Tax=Stachybotrys elegans TaxID=80388 RepID=A0A8K0STD4_9HYPO|nr:hypothetical protein B0I35DRAFT_429396 [Stachybotrys elegans]